VKVQWSAGRGVCQRLLLGPLAGEDPQSRAAQRAFRWAETFEGLRRVDPASFAPLVFEDVLGEAAQPRLGVEGSPAGVVHAGHDA
jgi:hypothetical protein